MRGLFDILVPAPAQARAPAGRAAAPMDPRDLVKDNHGMYEEQKAGAGGEMQIDSSAPKDDDAEKVDVDQMDFFMNAQERERAQTYYA